MKDDKLLEARVLYIFIFLIILTKEDPQRASVVILFMFIVCFENHRTERTGCHTDGLEDREVT